MDPDLLLALAVMLGVAKLCGDLFERIGMPSVLGELSAGIVLGNLHLAGWHVLDFAIGDAHLGFLGELGVILLLFQVGLESNMSAMARVGLAAFGFAVLRGPPPSAPGPPLPPRAPPPGGPGPPTGSPGGGSAHPRSASPRGSSRTSAGSTRPPGGSCSAPR